MKNTKNNRQKKGGNTNVFEIHTFIENELIEKKNKKNFTGFLQLKFLLNDHRISHCFGSLFVVILHFPGLPSLNWQMHGFLILIDEDVRATNDSFAIG